MYNYSYVNESTENRRETRANITEHYPGVLSNVAEMLSHPIEGEVQDIDHITEQEIIEIE